MEHRGHVARVVERARSDERAKQALRVVPVRLGAAQLGTEHAERGRSDGGVGFGFGESGGA